MFVSTAWAQGAAAGGGGLFEALVPLILIFAVFYFLLIRPQQKKQKDHQNKLKAIRRGDKIVTGGGIRGTVTKVTQNENVDELTVEIAENVKIVVLRATVMDVVTKPEPAAGGEAKTAKPANDPGGGAAGFLGKLMGKKPDK